MDVNLLQIFATSFAFSVCIICALRPLAVRIGLVDTPCKRKQHVGHIPLVGGLAIYAAVLAMGLIFPFWRAQHGGWLIGLGLALLLIGLADDKWQVSASIRFLVEIGCSLVAAVYCDVRLDDLGSLLPGVGGTLFWLAIPLTVVGAVGAINSFNMSDGVDGLAGGLATLTFGALAWLAYPSNTAVALQLTSLVGILLGFLVYNSRFFGRKRASIFMGDGGSILIGFALAWYLIRLSQGPGAVITPASALWLFALPLMDTMSIMSRRIARGQSPFAADREHLHHLLLATGLSVNATVLVKMSAQLVCILLGIASILLKVPTWIVFVLFVGLFAMYTVGMKRAWQVMRQSETFADDIDSQVPTAEMGTSSVGT